jgi:hypothetical protein
LAFKIKEVKKMKKLFALALVLGVGALLISGCQDAQQIPAEAIPESQIANSIAVVSGMSVTVDNAVRQASGFGVYTMGVTSTPTYSEGWWHTTINTTEDAYTYSANVDFRLWKLDGSLSEVVNALQLATLNSSNLDQIYLYASFNLTLGSDTITLRMGVDNTDEDSLKYTHILGNTMLNGPVSYSGSYAGINYTATVNYVNVELMANGFPYGTANFEVSTDGIATSGNVVFDGLGSATVNFSGGGSVDVDLFRF